MLSAWIFLSIVFTKLECFFYNVGPSVWGGDYETSGVFHCSTMTSLRASLRLKEKNENKPPAPSAQNVITIKASSATSRPRKKQKKEAAISNTDSMQSTNFARIKGRKGKLRFMTEMPIDTCLKSSPNLSLLIFFTSLEQPRTFGTYS